MTGMNDVDTNELIDAVAKTLKKSENIKMPEWAKFVKTGQSRDRIPMEPDWWHTRVAAVLRTVALKGPVGVSKLRIKFGGNKRRGHKPEHFRKASGKILRLILQQLEKDGLIKYAEKGVHKGRVLTPKGKSLLDKAVKIKK